MNVKVNSSQGINEGQNIRRFSKVYSLPKYNFSLKKALLKKIKILRITCFNLEGFCLLQSKSHVHHQVFLYYIGLMYIAESGT